MSTTVNRAYGPDRRHEPLLEVVVRHPRDAGPADEGGAHRLFLVAGTLDDTDAGGLSPEPALVSGVCKESHLPLRVLLRLSDSHTTTGAELARLVGLAESYLAAGAEGVAFGFLERDLLVDVELCADLAGRLPGVPWTFTRAIDDSLEPAKAWRDLPGLPGLDAVCSAGSPRGLAAGADELTDRAAAHPDVARLLLAGGGLRGEHVPWLVRAGVRQFQVGGQVRPGGSWDRSYADSGHVRAWRMLLDDAVGHVESSAAAPPHEALG